jgi:ubiquinone/menaquinone biosynthesis C-methylase UbiE
MTFYETNIFPTLNDLVTKGFGRFRKDLLTMAKGKVLEIGMGSGMSFDFYPHAVTSVDAIDPNPSMLERAKEKPNTKIKLQLGQAEQLNFEDDSFDTIICFLVYAR